MNDIIQHPYFNPALVLISLLTYAAAIGIYLYYRKALKELTKVYELDHLDGKLERSRVQLLESEKRVQALQTEGAEADAQLKEAKWQLEAVQARKKESTESLESNVAELRETLQQLGSKKEQLEEQIHACQVERRNTEATLGDLQAKKKELKTLEEKCAKEDLHHRELLKRQSELTLEVGELERNLEGLQKERDSYDTILKELASRMEKFEHAIKPPPLAERLQDFERPVLTPLPTDSGESTKSEETCLKEFHSALGNAGFVFPTRLLHSFHAALKTTDYSPLVVLAGVSGTGKSQLPRLYASHMGFQFMNVAVQPRWDSPQDLFGFYNYMEHRYKATELSRALRQMDRLTYPAKEGEERAIQEGMLLVLLDEMNLARVEYYFSELLSKLEMRSADLEDRPDLQALAAIEVETGALDTDQRSKSLLVGNNVLFVGTMNEDESTLSMSDKVLDRANVLRFGRPEDLRMVAGKSGSSAGNSALSFRQWRDWIHSPLEIPEIVEELSPQLNRLNRIMEELGKPFGHRTSLSMMHYAVNYPQWVSGAPMLALSDILGQKALPRLRGISTDEHPRTRDALEELSSLIRDTGDDALTEAFSEAASHSIFEFKGLRHRGEDNE